MVIKYKPKFERELKTIFNFIAKDSLNRAREFKNELIAKIERTAQTPFICRKIIYMLLQAKKNISPLKIKTIKYKKLYS